ncbi:GNAT family N-acetyltransferase [Paenibacillus monticola]|uniref:GNAT family N-acetyltransferase n=1 Tax=Paenibacillus monticola TaxID=2666075 RepID=A0A7X2L239_9BACL|nr:GNAT family N-acetyltransferase [Paenibacillus monticola]MRN52941.1 GNAT family N-acetyltransferase [Paenibacillus monticola]
MSLNPIEIVAYQKEDNEAVRELIVDSFLGKFHALVHLDINQIRKLLGSIWIDDPNASTVKQIVAKENGKVVGTLCLKWKGNAPSNKRADQIHIAQLFKQFGYLNVCKFIVGMCFLDYQPKAHECYIDHLAIRSSHRNKGIGGQLLAWAQHFTLNSEFDQLSLHVVSNNKQAIHLYEKMAFDIERSNYNMMRHIFFQYPIWNFMSWRASLQH